MVRLKAKKTTINKNSKKISIPYGAIKRFEKAQRPIITGISIPYGAIKSHTCTHLKICNAHISIPYGAIKRVFIIL